MCPDIPTSLPEIYYFSFMTLPQMFTHDVPIQLSILLMDMKHLTHPPSSVTLCQLTPGCVIMIHARDKVLENLSIGEAHVTTINYLLCVWMNLHAFLPCR